MTTVATSSSRSLLIFRSVGSAGLLFTVRALSVIYQLRFANTTFGISYGGLIALLNQITFYILLAELGLAAATTSLLFEPSHRGDLDRVGALMRALQQDVRRIVRYLAPILAIVSLILSVWLRRELPVLPLLLSVLLTCAAALLTFTALPYQSHFNATDRVPLRNVILACGFALKVLMGIALAKSLHSFVGLPLGTAIVGVAELLIQRHLVLSRLRGILVPDAMIADARSSIRERAKYVLAHRIGYLIIYQSDYLILLMASSLSLLGYYAQYQYIYAGLLSFSIAIGGTLTARIAKSQLDLGKAFYPEFYRRTSLLAGAGAIFVGSGFYLFSDSAIRMLYRTIHYDRNAVVLFAILLMLNIFKMNDDLWIDTTGTYQKWYYLPICESVTYVLLGMVFVQRWQVAGILCAGIVTNLLFSVIGKSFVIGEGVMRREVGSTLMVKAACVIAIGAASYLLVSMQPLLAFAQHAR